MMTSAKKKSIKWWAGVLSCIMLFALIGGFSFFKTKSLVRGVEITASLEHSGSTSIAEIQGSAKNAVYVSLNGREIFIDQDGIFSEPLLLLPGLSVVTLSAQDKFGKTSEKKFELMYTENNKVALVSNQ